MSESVLLVEDDADMRKLIRFSLSADPTLEIVAEACNGEEAAEMALEHQPSVVLLDHFIDGGATGLQVAPIIKDCSPASKILLFTSHELNTESSREPSIDGYLQKDRVMELLPTVQALLAY